MGHVSSSFAATRSVYHLRYPKPEALAAIANIPLPSMHECAVKVSEGFYRLNGVTPTSQRWSRVGLDTSIRNRLSRTKSLADFIQWEFHSTPQGELISYEGTPAASECDSFLLSRNGEKIRLVQDWLGTWGYNTKHRHVHITAFTDGSASYSTKSSAWAVCFADDWLDENYESMPPDLSTIWSSTWVNHVWSQ